jgi:hypothetical protein
MFFKKIKKWTFINVQNERKLVGLLGIFVNLHFFEECSGEKKVPQILWILRAALRAAGRA